MQKYAAKGHGLAPDVVELDEDLVELANGWTLILKLFLIQMILLFYVAPFPISFS